MPSTNSTACELQKATFAMSWFWFPEAQFGVVDGVVRTKVGYAGGTTEFPTYYNIGDHAETIQIEFDENQISYETLLGIFWENHNPTAMVKRQYMSAIFYNSEDQKAIAERSLEETKKKFRSKPVRTEIAPAGKFYDAEDYHQKYILRQQRGIFKSLNLSDEQVKSSPMASKLTGFFGGYGGSETLEKMINLWDLNDHQKTLIRRFVKNQGCNGMYCSF